MASLLPPNRQNKKRKQRRAVERFEGEVLEYMDHLLKQQFCSSFRDQNTRRRYAEEVARNNIVGREVENYFNCTIEMLADANCRVGDEASASASN